MHHPFSTKKSEPLVYIFYIDPKLRLAIVRYPHPGIGISALFDFEAGIGWRTSDMDGKAIKPENYSQARIFL